MCLKSIFSASCFRISIAGIYLSFPSQKKASGSYGSCNNQDQFCHNKPIIGFVILTYFILIFPLPAPSLAVMEYPVPDTGRFPPA